MNRHLRIVLRIICIGVTAIGLTGFFGGVFIMLNALEWNHELPISSTESLIIGDNGNIYISLGFFGTIQQYNQEGQFISNWNIDSSGGAFNMQRVGNEIKVQIIRTDKTKYFDFGGKLIREHDLKESYNSANYTVALDSLTGTRFMLDTNIPVSIIKVDDNKQTTIVKQSLFYLLFDSVIPWNLAAIGIIGLFMLNDKNYFRRLIVINNKA